MSASPVDQQPESSTLRGDIAIIGMACIFPGAADLDAYWQNIVSKVDAIGEPPPNSWDPSLYYDPDSTENYRVYCKRGGYLGELARFNPLEHGIMPVTVNGGEPDQWLALSVAHDALADAGYLERDRRSSRTEVILGKGTYVNRGNMTVGYHGVVIDQVLHILKNLHPEHSEADLEAIKQELKSCLPPFGADTAPALIGNILAGRIANRLDLMGPSYTVDGACASALLAAEIGVRNLLSHKSDLALVGGVHVNTPVPVFGLFCQLNALSHREQIRPFDKDADGTILGEGLGMVVLKRLEDAERDEDRIYAVIKGVGSSSDGRAIHVMAPRLEGEVLALQRAYEMAGISPDSVALVEAHGTATPVGDAVEIQALRQVFGDRNGASPRCALGSVKSMIGHTMPAAGIASLIKTALALHHKILPPTLHCEEPNPKLELSKTHFYPNIDTRPWIHGRADTPRRAGVNAFGFGGINAHVVLEEYVGPNTHLRKTDHALDWETEVCILEGPSREGLMDRVRQLVDYLERSPQSTLKDLAYTLNTGLEDAPYRLCVVATSLDDLQAKLQRSLDRLGSPTCRQIKDVSGIYFFEERVAEQGKLAFLFPGEGSQYANMLLDLCLHFPEVRSWFDLADRAFIDHPRNYVPSDFIFPRSSFSDPERPGVEQKLWEIDGAVEAVLVANWAMLTLLSRLEIRPDAILGHSTGDYAAMFASGIIDVTDEPGYIQTIVTLNSMYGRLSDEVTIPEAGLVAAATDHATSAAIVEEVRGDVYVAMDNCPHQSVIVGTKAAAAEAAERLQSRGVIYEFLPFDRPYHTPLFGAYAEGWLRDFFAELPVAGPKVPIYSCTTAEPYPSDRSEIQELFVAHWIRQVRFRETIERMYTDGVRVFVEVGPRGNLTAFVDDILRGSPHLAVPSNTLRRSGITQLNHLCAQLAAQGVPMKLDYLYARRLPRRLDLENPEVAATRKADGSMRLALGVPPFEVSPRDPAPARPPSTPSGVRATPAPFVADNRLERPTGSKPVVPMPASTVGRPSGARTHVMQDYVATMDRFLGLQEQVMRTYLGGPRGGALPSTVAPAVAKAKPMPQVTPPGGASPAATTDRRNSELPSYPLLGEVTTLVPGEKLVSLRQLDLREDIFLLEHALGGRVSSTDETLRPLSIVPLTISMEMLAEAGAALMPHRTLVGMKDIRAYRWIQIEDAPVAVSVTARRRPAAPDEVEVEIKNAKGSAQAVMQGVMIFGDAYPESPPPTNLSLDSEPGSRLASANLYDGTLMFHGPCFQGVASVDRSGQDGLVGQLRVLPADRLFRSESSPRFVTDPVVLDAAGQLVGYWTAEHLERGFVVFPYRVEALHIYGPNRPPGESVTCRLRLRLVGTSQIRSDLDLVGTDDRVWMRVVGWEDSRFDLPERFHRFWVAPKREMVSLSWRAPLEPSPLADALECCRLERPFENSNQLWTDLWASLILTRGERRAFQESDEVHRGSDWLLGRAVAKDAVRAFLRKHRQLELLPADIDIDEDELGRPVPTGPWAAKLSSVPSLSVAVKDGLAVALVGPSGNGLGLGVGVERVRALPPEFRASHFTPDEQAVLDSVTASDREEWAVRCWCAKESVAAALGRKRVEGLQGIQVLKIDAQTGIITVQPGGELVGILPQLGDVRMIAYTLREGDYIVATTACEVESS